ncbi:MAG: TonB-dependent receptor plug domain-containing protein [Pseudomonadota bacterium]
MIHRRCAIHRLGLAIAVAPIPLWAQAPADVDSREIEEVFVSATKTETTLQDLDLSATVLSRQDLIDARVTDIRRIDDLVPNVQFNDTGQIGAVYISIRGVESNPFIVNRAAVYIDGIPFRELNNSVLAQLDGVEVLRGPQSTLYGANTSSGLVLLKTRAPSDERIADATLTATTFGNGDSLQLTGFLGAPLVGDSLVGSLSYRFTDADYYVENIGATPQGPGQFDETFLQGRLRWEPNEKLTVNATGYYIDTAAPGIYRFDGYPVELDAYNAIYSDGALFDPANPFSPPPVNGNLRADDFSFVNNAPKRAEIEEFVFGLSATVYMGSGNLDLAFSHRSEEIADKGFDIDNTNGPFLAGAQFDDVTVTTGEIRFTADPVNGFSYNVGASFYLEDEKETLASLVGGGGLDDFIRAPEQGVDSRDWGVFSSVSYSPQSLDRLTFTAGLRFDSAERTTTQQAGVLDLGFSQFFFQELDLNDTFEELLYRFAVRYELSEDLTLYSNLASGYVPGGFNIAAAEEDALEDVVRFGQEELISFDAGLRWRSADRRKSFSTAVFYLEADNWQEITALEDEEGNVISTSIVTSRAAIESMGIEFEGRVQFDHGLLLTANLGLIDADYTDFAGQGADQVIGGPVKLIPDYDGNVALRWAFAGGWFLRGEVNLIGEMALDEGIRQGFDANALATQEAVEIYGLQLGWEGERFSARLFAENLTEERRFSGGAFPNAFFPNDGLLYGAIDAPRVVGLELNLSL